MPSKELPDGDWSKRHHPISFRRLMQVKTIRASDGPDEPWVFESTSSAYAATETPRTYGGHVFAQSAWAAALTVPRGSHVHSVTGWFLLIGDSRVPLLYRIKSVRNGGVYVLRHVEVFQENALAAEGKTPMFVAYVSFKKDESEKVRNGQRLGFGHQEEPPDWLMKEYGSILSKKSIEKWPLAQSRDALWYDKLSVEQWQQRSVAFPGLEMRKVDMREYNGPSACDECDGGDATRRWRMLIFYRIIREQDEVPSPEYPPHFEHNTIDDINVHACAHLYASDRDCSFLAQRSLGITHEIQVGSLSHTVTFTVPVQDLSTAEDNTRKWFVHEVWINGSGDGRICHKGRLWDYNSGKIIASAMQDGIMRIPTIAEVKIIDGEPIIYSSTSKL